MGNTFMRIFGIPVSNPLTKEEYAEETVKKVERKITVTYVDKTILPDVFNDIDDVNYEDIWTRIRLKNRKLVVISNSQILRMENEWETKQI